VSRLIRATLGTLRARTDDDEPVPDQGEHA